MSVSLLNRLPLTDVIVLPKPKTEMTVPEKWESKRM